MEFDFLCSELTFYPETLLDKNFHGTPVFC